MSQANAVATADGAFKNSEVHINLLQDVQRDIELYNYCDVLLRHKKADSLKQQMDARKL